MAGERTGERVASPYGVGDVRPGTMPGLLSVSDNGDGTSTVRRRREDGAIGVRVVANEDLTQAQQAMADGGIEVLGRKLGKGMQDCVFCRYGKPAIGGAVAGLALASIAGMEPTRGVVWGGISGLLYGHLRG